MNRERARTERTLPERAIRRLRFHPGITVRAFVISSVADDDAAEILGDAEEGGRIPVSRNGQPGWLQYENQEVWSKMDGSLLESVAAAGGGVFVPAGTSLVDLGEFFADWITTIDLRDRDEGTARRTIPRFQWFAGVALVLMIVEMLIGDRRRRPAKPTRAVESRRMNA